jgi:hypothetical protein
MTGFRKLENGKDAEYGGRDGEVWPNFFIVGAAKAGTNSLHAYLEQHPQVFMCPMKEVHYFSRLGARSGRQYLVDVVSDRASYLALFEGATGFPAVGERSVTYLGYEDTADAIHEQVPNAKIVILLRDPIERAYSHYLMDVRNGVQDLPFFETVVKEHQNPEFGWGRVWHRYTMFYYPKVKRYLDVFGPEQVLILLTEDLRRDPRAVTKTALEFLDLDPAPVAEIDFATEHNPYAAPRNSLARSVMGSNTLRFIGWGVLRIPKPVFRFVRDRILFKRQEKPPLDAPSRAFLREVFASDVDKLETLLNRPLPELRRSWE